MSDVQKYGEEFQRVGKDGFDAAVRSFGQVNKGLQAIAAEVTDYSKKAFEDGTRAFEQLSQCEVVRAGNRGPVSIPQNGL